MADTPEAKVGFIKSIMTSIIGLLSGAILMYLSPLVNNAIKPPRPVANFASQSDGLTATFNNRSTGGSDGWWDFGDGSALEPFSPNQPTLVHRFPRAGTYSVKLGLHNYLGEEAERTVPITVTEETGTPKPVIESFQIVSLRPDNAAPATFKITGQIKNAELCIWSFSEDRPVEISTDTSPKQERLVTFDPALGDAMGFSARKLHFLLIALIAGNTVTAFEAVGSILVLAMFIVPAVTARLVTDRLGPMLLASALFAFSASVIGYILASPFVFPNNVGGMIAVVAGVQFFLAVLGAPRHGLLARLSRLYQLTLRIAREEILATLYRSQESGQPLDDIRLTDHGFSNLTVGWAWWQLRHRGLVANRVGRPALTEKGRAHAASIVRAHRLWEAYLVQHFDLPLDHLHGPASRIEHFIGPELQSELRHELLDPNTDPHGRRIPGPESPGG